MPFISTKNIKLYYESAGHGEAVLYISGTGGDLRKSPSVFDNDLKNNFHLISYDQRGLGQSETPDGPYTMQDYADDAFNFAAWSDCKLDKIESYYNYQHWW